jgi:Tol biopolymer transport system component
MKTPRRLVLLPLLALATLTVLLPSTPAGAVVPGQNGRIAFVSNRSGTNQVYSMRSDGTGVTQLTTLGVNTDPNWSPTGQKIVFVSTRDGSAELYTMDASGANQARLTTNTITESHPVWAPNGKLIAFAGTVGADSEIFRISSSGTQLVNLTNNATAFDADPAWSPGGQTIAFDSTDRNGPGTGTDVYTMGKDGSAVTQLTFTGVDSNPSWSPDNKNLAFESGRDNLPPAPSVFCGVTKPMGIAVTSSAVLAMQFNSDNIKKITSSCTVSNFAVLPPTGTTVERYLAVSPGLGGFPAGYVYATVGANIYQVTPDGLTVTLFKNMPGFLNGETGITFDTVGTFGFKMILTDRRGPIWTVDSAGNATLIGDVGQQIEGPIVAPTSFVPYAGQIIVANEFADKVFAMNSAGVVTQVTTVDGGEGAVTIPSTVCNLSGTTGAYFVAMEDLNQVWSFPASMFTGMGNDIMIPSELITDFWKLHSNGSTISTTQFYPAIGTPDLEGSAFAPCTSGPGKEKAPQTPATSGPREIYRMSSTGGGQTRLTTNTADDVNPAVSPDGLSIVFMSDRDNPGTYETYKMAWTDGSGQTNISNNTSANDTNPDWQSVAVYTTVGDFFYSPTGPKPKMGGIVEWDNTGPSSHTATDGSGMDYFDSGTLTPGQVFLFGFPVAGNYAVECTIHPGQMSQTIKVPMTAVPKTGGLTTVFTITWAVAPAPPVGYDIDVQIFKPGASDWADFKTDTSTKFTSFTANAGTGVYSFRARLEKLDQLTFSDWSAAVSITVNP